MTCPHCDEEMAEMSPKWPVLGFHCLECGYYEERDDTAPPPTYARKTPILWKGPHR